MTAVVVFKACVEAMRKGTLIERVSATDKEFHFQNWFTQPADMETDAEDDA